MSIARKSEIWKLVQKRDIPRLIEALKHKKPEIRQRAANGLGMVSGDQRVIDALAAALTDHDRTVRYSAERSLERYGTSSLEALAAAVGDDDHAIRLNAALALGHLGDVRAVQPLIDALSELRQNIYAHDDKCNIIQTLNGMRDPSVTEALFAALEDPARQSAALAVLAARGRQAAVRLLPLLAAQSDLRGRVDNLEIIVNSAPETLVALLGEKDYSIQTGALQIAAAGAGSQAVEQAVLARIPVLERQCNISGLIKLAEYQFGEGFRAQVIAAIGRIGRDQFSTDTVAHQLLLAEADDCWQPEVFTSAVYALPAIAARTGGLKIYPEGRTDLVHALTWHKHAEQTATMLAGIGDAVAIGILLEAAREPYARRVIESALGRVKDPDLLVAGLRSDDTGVQEMTAVVLRGRDGVAVDPLLRIFREDRLAAPLAARILGEIGDPRAIAPLAAAIKSGPDKLDYAIAVAKIGGPRAVEWLSEFLTMPDEPAAKAAAIALSLFPAPDSVRALLKAVQQAPHTVFIHSAAALERVLERNPEVFESTALENVSQLESREYDVIAQSDYSWDLGSVETEVWSPAHVRALAREELDRRDTDAGAIPREGRSNV